MKTFKNFLNAKTLSPEDIANKHNVSLSHINKQLSMGMEVEKEHSKDINVAREIALDHLREIPNYYTKLRKMENKKRTNNQ